MAVKVAKDVSPTMILGPRGICGLEGGIFGMDILFPLCSKSTRFFKFVISLLAYRTLLPFSQIQ